MSVHEGERYWFGRTLQRLNEHRSGGIGGGIGAELTKDIVTPTGHVLIG
jgi:hypothetical protein